MILISMICLLVLSSLVSNCDGKTYTFSWEAPTEPIIYIDEEEGPNPPSAEVLLRNALTTTREVLEMQTKFLIGVIQQYYSIKQKQNVTWTNTLENILLNCQSIIDYDLEEIRVRLITNKNPFDTTINPLDPGSIPALLAHRMEPPDFTTNPLRPASVSNLIHNFNHIMIILEDDETLIGVANYEIQAIRRILDNAEGELHRFNFRVRKIMQRIALRLSSTPTVNNSTNTQTTPLT